MAKMPVILDKEVLFFFRIKDFDSCYMPKLANTAAARLYMSAGM